MLYQNTPRSIGWPRRHGRSMQQLKAAKKAGNLWLICDGERREGRGRCRWFGTYITESVTNSRDEFIKAN